MIEVCDSSLAKDRGVKLPIYASARVPEVWLIDLKRRVILTHRMPVDGTYADQDLVRRSATIATGGTLDLELYASAILA